MKYPFSVAQMESEGHVYWVAKSSQLNGCVGQGDSVEEALAELAGNEEVWLETAADVGIPIPDVYVEKTQTYSGKLTLRVAPSVHERAAYLAKKDGISLNQYINDAVVAYNKENSVIDYVSSKVSSVSVQINRKFVSGESYNHKSEVISIAAFNFSPQERHSNTRS